MALLFFGACNNEPKNAFTIQGQFENISDSYLVAVTEIGDSLIIDTVQVDNKGVFKMSGITDTLSIVSFYFKGAEARPSVLVDKGWNVNVKGDLSNLDLIEVSGGVVNDDLSKFKESVQNLLKERATLLNDTGVLPNSEEDSVNIKNKDVKLKNVNFELMNAATKYIKENPSKVSSVLIMNELFKNEESLDRLSESLKLLRGRASDFPLTERLKAYEAYIRKSAKGSTAPAFLLDDIKGKSVGIREMNGKFVLLSFTSTECPMCDERYKQLKEQYQTLKNGKEKYNIEFVIVVKDIENREIDKILTAEKWTVIPVEGGWATKIFEDYNVNNIPYNILISPQGKIVERNISAVNLKTILDKYPQAKLTNKSKFGR